MVFDRSCWSSFPEHLSISRRTGRLLRPEGQRPKASIGSRRIACAVLYLGRFDLSRQVVLTDWKGESSILGASVKSNKAIPLSFRHRSQSGRVDSTAVGDN